MQIVVIGAGIVGLHVAHALHQRGDEVFVLDQAPHLAEHTSGRNSGVIHSGIFYRPGSFKEKVCIEGNRFTYEWLERLRVPHRRTGKWVVPEQGQEGDLGPFYEKISRLPIERPERVSAAELKKREPSLRESEAIFVPSTGIVDAAAYVNQLATYVQELGAQLVLNCQVRGINKGRLETNRGEIEFDLAVNSAGLYADEIARMAGLTGYEIRPCRGDYYLLNQQPVPRPVYHLPYRGAAGLGIHLTPTLDGQTLLGPNAFFIGEKTDYRHASPPTPFEEGVRFYLPGLTAFRIQEGYSGNRPKLYKDNEPLGEFLIEARENWVHLLGIESPGLTSAPALALEVSRLIS